MKKQTTKKQLQIRTQWRSGVNCGQIFDDCKAKGKDSGTCLAEMKYTKVKTL